MSTSTKSFFYVSAPLKYLVLDIEQVKVNGDDSALKTFELSSSPPVQICDVLVAGAGMGGIAAAIEASKQNSTILTEETTWIGGQMTSQGVCALDENKYVETSGACKSYLEMREGIRQAYRESGKLTEEAAADPLLHPGKSWVTRLAFEPQVALPVLNAMLAPAIEAGRLMLKQRFKVVAAAKQASIQAVLFVNLDSGEFLEVQSRIVIDATELGDLLYLADIPYMTGSDSRSETGENHAPLQGDSENVQDYTYPFVLEYHPGKSFLIDKPADYDKFQAEGKFSFYGYHMFEEAGKFLPFWTYRRLIDKSLFKPGTYQSDVSMINWDSNDLRGKNIIDKDPAEQNANLALAKRLSLGFLHWLQTEAARDDGGKGYPELKLMEGALGTTDGLSMHPYIREARRLSAHTVVVEHDIVESSNLQARARIFEDAVGIGLYPVDIHGPQEIAGAAQAARPFQIPLGSLISEFCPNYIAACKNIGVSHITNGAYRLHPVEWAIGVAAGTLANIFLSRNNFGDLKLLTLADIFDLQMALTSAECGSPIFWFDDVAIDHPQFQAIQMMTVCGIISYDKDSLSFAPDEEVSEETIKESIENLKKLCDGMDCRLNLKIRTGVQVSRAELAETLFKALNVTLTLKSIMAPPEAGIFK